MSNIGLGNENIFVRAFGGRTGSTRGGPGLLLVAILVIVSLFILIRPTDKKTADTTSSVQQPVKNSGYNVTSTGSNDSVTRSNADNDVSEKTTSSVEPHKDNNTSSYERTSTNEVTTSCWLTELDYLVKENVIVKDTGTDTTNLGDTISHTIHGYRDGAEISYYLKKRYSGISGLWTVTQAYRDTSVKSMFELYADDILVYTSPTITGGDLPETFEVNINNCDVLKIRFVAADTSAKIANIRLDPAAPTHENSEAEPVRTVGGTWLTDLDYLIKEDTIVKSKGTVTTNTGETYSHCIWGYRDGAEVEYVLNGDYKRVSAIWGINETYKDTDVKSSFEVYSDGILIYSSPVITGGDTPVPIEIDLNNCQRLKIKFPAGAYVSSVLFNIMLYKE